MAALDPGAVFPALALTDESGRAASPRTGTETLYAVFKTTCPTCELAWPYLDRIRAIGDGGGFSIVAVSQDDAEKTREFGTRLGTNLATLYDRAPWPSSDALRVTNVPTLFRVGADGKVAETLVGFDRARMESLAGRAAALAGKPSTQLFGPDDKAPAFKPG